MPVLIIRTNRQVEDESRKSLLTQASSAVAEALGKPEQYVMVSLEENQPMLFAGSDAPLAYLELKSIGLPSDRTREISAILCTFIGQHLDIPQARIYIEFADAARNMFGWNGGTFER
ncbi:MAG: phenylpyruvate tautomerase MIF-related protein [Candidatus Sedimenticola sp. 20ELBAFRAG]